MSDDRNFDEQWVREFARDAMASEKQGSHIRNAADVPEDWHSTPQPPAPEPWVSSCTLAEWPHYCPSGHVAAAPEQPVSAAPCGGRKSDLGGYRGWDNPVRFIQEIDILDYENSLLRHEIGALQAEFGAKIVEQAGQKLALERKIAALKEENEKLRKGRNER